MPGFPRVLAAIAEAYGQNRGEIDRVAQQLSAQMGRSGQTSRGTNPLTMDILHQAYSGLATSFDYQNGGIGTAPKFPQPMTLEVLLRYYQHGYNQRALEMVEFTLEKMAYGGIYDQIGGGFHRYSTDAFWLVPHFEKMLYDNALLARLYLHCYLITHTPLYRRITEETLDYVLREMTDPDGGFYSPRTPTARARRVNSSSGRLMKSAPPWATRKASLWAASLASARQVISRVRTFSTCPSSQTSSPRSTDSPWTGWWT